MRKFFLLSVMMGMFLAVTQTAFGYYDDVHYALTYYIARQSGYTPLQSYRIASACSMVDWDPHTEPVQSGGQAYLLFTKLASSAQNPRWKFHAMRNELRFNDVLGNGKDAGLADGAIIDQRNHLFQMALNETKNPGVFLHAFEDEKPHHGYGTAWGHWPMLPGCVAEYKAQNLPIGGSTDWVSHRIYDVQYLCEMTNSYLAKFMDKVSPHQYFRPFYDNEYSSLVQQLGIVNPEPGPIDTELKRQIYIQYYAKSAGITQQYWGNLVDPKELSDIASQLKVGLSAADLEKQKNGPDLGRAILAVNAALKRAGMSDTVTPTHQHYELDDEGRLDNEAQRDSWVLTGSLETSIRGSSSMKAILKCKVRDRNGVTKEMPVHGYDPIQMKPGVEQRWENLPIGDIILELEKKDGSKIEKTFALNKQENKFPPINMGDERIGGHWLWVRETKDAKGKVTKDEVPAYLTPQDNGDFNGVYFPYLTYKILVRTPDRSPTRISFKATTGNTFQYTWEYPNGPKGTGTMTYSGTTLTGNWVENGTGNKGDWKWVRPTPEQEAILRKFFGR